MTPLQQAAQALIEQHLPTYLDRHIAKLRKALDAELQQSVEPVAFKQFLSDVITAAGLVTHGKQCKALGERISDGAFQYMLHPPQQAKQVPMTDEQIEAACRFIEPSFDGPIAYDLQIARAIEAHHGIGGQP